MKNMLMFAVFAVLIIPANASAAMLNATPAEIMDVLTAEVTFLNNQVSENGIVAGVSTEGLAISINGNPTLQFHGATEFHVAKELCYLMSVAPLTNGDNYNCEFNGTLIFESAVDAK